MMTLAVFFMISLLLALTPGPDNIFVLTLSTLHGPRAGFLVTIGLCTGLIIHSMIVAGGVAALLLAIPVAFDILRLCGACYLLLLAWQSFNAATRHLGSNGTPTLTGIQLYRRGILMNITNPKVLLFFLAFLPQFVDPAQGSTISQVSLLGGLFIIATLLVFGGIALLAGHIGLWVNRSASMQKSLHLLASAIFIALAINLAVTY